MPTPGGVRGFSLVELIAVMVVLGVIGSIGVMSVQRAAVASGQVALRAQLMSEASVVMDRLVQMVKFTPVRAGSPGMPAISYVDADEIVWENGDELDVPSAAPTTLLLRSVRDGDAPGSTPRLLARDVAAFTLRPLDWNEQPMLASGVTVLNTPELTGQVHAMDLTLTLSRGGVSVTLLTRVFLRARVELSGP